MKFLGMVFLREDHKIITKNLNFVGLKGVKGTYRTYTVCKLWWQTNKYENCWDYTEILGPLLSLIFVSNLHKVKKYLDPIIFAKNRVFFISIKM